MGFHIPIPKVWQRTPELLLCLILPKIKFFVITVTEKLLKYQITASILEATFILKVFP